MICTECNQPIPDDTESHWDHENDCEHLAGRASCRCDRNVHPECCRVCALDARVLEPT